MGGESQLLLVSDAETDLGVEAGLEHLLNMNPCFTINRLCVFSKCGFTSEPSAFNDKGPESQML